MISKRAKEQFGVENFFALGLKLETLNSDDGIKKGPSVFSSLSFVSHLK